MVQDISTTIRKTRMLKSLHCMLISATITAMSCSAVAGTTEIAMTKDNPVAIVGEVKVNNKIADNEKIVAIEAGTKNIIDVSITDKDGEYTITTPTTTAKAIEIYAANYPDFGTTVTCGYKGCKGEASLYIIDE